MGEKEWYFFSLRDRKYPTGVRTNRATNTGYWKTTGKDKEIYNSVSSELVGMKKTLVFYKGRAPRGEKSNWVMHEYRIHTKSSYRTTKQDEWAVCRVFQKSAGVKKYASNHSRAIPTYNLDIGPSAMPTQMMQQADIQFPMGRNNVNYADVQELTKVFRAGPSSINLPMQSHVNYAEGAGGGGGGGGGGGNYFTISGLNLHLGGAMAASTQHILRTMPPHPPAMSQEDLLAIQNEAAGFGADNMNTANTMSNNRFMPMDHCADLDNYWPSY